MVSTFAVSILVVLISCLVVGCAISYLVHKFWIKPIKDTADAALAIADRLVGKREQ